LHTYKGVLNLAADEFVAPTIVKNDLINLNTYITSDEKPKEGDYCFCTIENRVIRNQVHKNVPNSRKKIILTTDPDLIANGVQAINNEFLEWFVKNPSCEHVPIIPPLFGHPYIIWIEGLNFIEEPKQETPEEAASRLLYSKYPFHPPQDSGYWKDMFLEGAEWKAERMYSEEDLLSAFKAGMMFIGEDKGSFKEWFKQFKKK
jgi:hypothetical protein